MNNCPSCNQLIPEKQQPLVEISVVLPVFNEQETIKELYRRLTKTLQKISNSYELIFIDDGSKDLSFNLLEELTREDPKHMNVNSMANQAVNSLAFHGCVGWNWKICLIE